MSEENQIEEKVVNDQYQTADPVTPAGGDPKKRQADKNVSVDPSVDDVEDDVKTPQGTADKKAPKRSADKSMAESIEEVFNGVDLSEEFKQRTVAVFEAAVHERTVQIQEELEAKFENDLSEQLELAVDSIVEKVDAYLDYVVEQWMEENELAVESGIKVEMAESIMQGLTNLVSEHNLEVEESDLDIISDLEEKLEESTQQYNEIFDELLEMRQERHALEKEVAFQEVVENLTDTQADRLRVLSEGLSYETLDEYEQKLESIRDSYFKESVSASVSEDDTEVLQEESEDETQTYTDPAVSAYVNALSRFAAKN